MKILVTGSSGLIGSEAVIHFDREGHEVVGIDNNLRREFFGPSGDTLWNLQRIKQAAKSFRHLDLDIRDRQKILDLFKQERFEMIVHCAAQPSHDKAAEIPFADFDVNAVATLNLLEATRQSNKDAVFIFMSTNKVNMHGLKTGMVSARAAGLTRRCTAFLVRARRRRMWWRRNTAAISR